jgi:hypothetical protein
MNDPRSFDELARLKMAEREFTFHESDWAEMETLLNAQRKKRRMPLWSLAAALLIATPLAWWILRDEATSAPSAPLANNVPETVTASQPIPTTQVMEPASHALAESATKSTPTKEQVTATQPQELRIPSPRPKRSAVNPRSVGEPQRATLITLDPPQEITGNATDASTGPLENLAITPTGPTFNAPDPIEPLNGVVASPSEPAENIGTSDLMDTAILRTDVATAHNDAEIASTDQPTDTKAEGPPAAVASGISPSGVETNLLIQDSTITAVASNTLNAMPVHRSQFEVSILGGALLSTSTYAGAATDAWHSGSSGQWSPSAGVEFLRITKHFGVGLGLHRARYEEQLQAERLSRTDDVINTSYSLLPIQITVPMITDTIVIGGVNYYVTTPVTTTVNQVITTTDTTQVTVIMREARTFVNRVDYWEVPLLLDAHTSVGRWTVGLRGGPSVSMLSIRKGSVPDTEGTGYVNLQETTYRTTMFGYQARAYVRYGISDHFSIGLEPTVRGQFGSAVQGVGMNRQNSAWGGLLSVNFRFP